MKRVTVTRYKTVEELKWEVIVLRKKAMIPLRRSKVTGRLSWCDNVWPA